MPEHPEIAECEWIDDIFRVYETKYKVWNSVLKDNTELITALTRDQCISATRFYLKGKQEGFNEPLKTHDGIVGGKL